MNLSDFWLKDLNELDRKIEWFEYQSDGRKYMKQTFFCFLLFKIFLEETSSFCEATDTIVIDFWWRLP